MIGHGNPTHNRRSASAATMSLIFILVPLLVGCGDSSHHDAEVSSESASSPCPVTIDDGPWKAFAGFCRLQSDDQPISRDDLQAFVEEPALSSWKESMNIHLSDIRIVNWLEGVFLPEDPEAPSKINKDRVKFGESYEYSIKHWQDIQERVDRFRAENLGCRVLDRAAFWLSEEARPKSLNVVFLPSRPEIRALKETVFVDTGVLYAGSDDQLIRQLTGLVFRDRGFLAGPPAAGQEGALAVAHSLRTMMNEGIGGYIEDQPGTVFAADHPKLGKVDIIPDSVFEHGRRAISLMELHIPEMAADPEVMQTKGQTMAKTFIASSSLHQGGYCLAACIAGNLGEDRLRETVGSPATFLRTYQEAALMNPSPAPEPYMVNDAMYRSMPPFDEAVLEALISICEEAFPTSAH